MKRLLLFVVALLLLAAAGTTAWFQLYLPQAQPAAELRIEPTPALVERGGYLARHVVLCIDCHSERDWTLYGGPAKPPFGAGRDTCITADSDISGIRVSEWTFPGRLCIRNITPDPDTGLGSWSDGEIIRAFREGIGRDGRPLFPIMPYFILRNIADEDARAIVAYLRSLDPVRAEHPQPVVGFPMSWFQRLFPEPVTEPVPLPDPADRLATGRYLATIARCEFCHTPRNEQTRQSVAGQEFAGGVPFHLHGGSTLYSTNLTPHPDGLGSWTREQFIARFKRDAEPRPVDPRDNTITSWHAYSGITEADLNALWDYFQTVPPKPAPADRRTSTAQR